jgi:hypothetical protein
MPVVMRVFRDSRDIEWTVFEVRRQVGAKGEMNFLPGGFSSGWLCFESMGAKRRLVRYPPRWREFADQELEQLLSEAIPAPRGSLRLGDDLSGGSDGATPRDLRSE